MVVQVISEHSGKYYDRLRHVIELTISQKQEGVDNATVVRLTKFHELNVRTQTFRLKTTK